MACVPYTTWITANAACRDKASGISVKGFGYVPAGMRAISGLGFSVSASITPASVANAITTGQLVQTAPSAAPAAPPVVSTAPMLNTTPVCNDPNDPCCIASQTPCPAGTTCPAVCPAGFHSDTMLSAPGAPKRCNCVKDHVVTATPATPSAMPGSPSAALTPAATSATGGFSKWGLLAALGLGAGALYLVTRKKASTS